MTVYNIIYKEVVIKEDYLKLFHDDDDDDDWCFTATFVHKVG